MHQPIRTTTVNSIKLLILTANPGNAVSLRGEQVRDIKTFPHPQNIPYLQLEQEVRDIKAALQRSKFRDQFEIIHEGAVCVSDLSRAMVQHQPAIVHFSGHGTGATGLVLEDEYRQPKFVPNAALEELFRQHKATVKCVFLNACYSDEQADAIFKQIDCVVGMNRAIGDNTAIQFSPQFYFALGQGCSFQAAFDSAKNKLQLDSNPEAATPILKIRQAAANLFPLPSPAASTPAIPQPQLDPTLNQSIQTGNIRLDGNSNIFNLVQGKDNEISQSVSSFASTPSDREAAIAALNELKQAIASTDSLGSRQKYNLDSEVEFLKQEIPKSKPDKSAIEQAIAALKTALNGVVTLAEPVTKVAELLAKFWTL